MRRFVAVALLLVGGCGYIFPSFPADTEPTARELCSSALSSAAIDANFEAAEELQDSGMTKVEALVEFAADCIGEDLCDGNTACAQDCIECKFAIVDEVY